MEEADEAEEVLLVRPRAVAGMVGWVAVGVVRVVKKITATLVLEAAAVCCHGEGGRGLWWRCLMSTYLAGRKVRAGSNNFYTRMARAPLH